MTRPSPKAPLSPDALRSFIMERVNSYSDASVAKEAAQLIDRRGIDGFMHQLLDEFLAHHHHPLCHRTRWHNFELILRLDLLLEDHVEGYDLIVAPVDRHLDFNAEAHSTYRWIREREAEATIAEFQSGHPASGPQDIRFLRSGRQPGLTYCLVPVFERTDGQPQIRPEDVRTGLRAVLENTVWSHRSTESAYRRILITPFGFGSHADRMDELVQTVWSELRNAGYRRMPGAACPVEGMEIEMVFSSTQTMTSFFRVMLDEGEVLREHAHRHFREQPQGVKGPMVGLTPSQSHQMQGVITRALTLAADKRPVLIEGESGSGKETLARYIWEKSPRSGNGFEKVQCSTLTSQNFDSRLFGMRSGPEYGDLIVASNGVVYFDGLEDLSLECQSKVADLLEAKEYRPTGWSHPIRLDIRFIAGSRTSLQILVKQGNFRQDLYGVFGPAVLRLPPLRLRTEDIPTLIHDMMQQLQDGQYHPHPAWSDEAITFLKRHKWPNNLHDLKRVVRTLQRSLEEDSVTVGDIREYLPDIAEAIEFLGDTPVPIPEDISRTWLKYFKQDYLQLRLQNDWTTIEANVSEMARDHCIRIQHEDGIKGRTVRDRLSHEVPHRVERMLTARRVILGCYKLLDSSKTDQYRHLIKQLGFVRDDEADVAGECEALQQENFKNYLSEIGLKQCVIKKPREKNGLWREEIEWLNNFCAPAPR